MPDFFGYFRSFFRSVHSGLLVFCVCYAAIIIFLNYRFGIETKILFNVSNRLIKLAGFYFVYLAAFLLPYLFCATFSKRDLFRLKPLWLLVFVAPAIFAIKVNFTDIYGLILEEIPGDRGRFLAIIANLPSRLLPVLLCLALVWWIGRYPRPFFGVTVQQVKWKPYLIMLLIMVPLIAWASTQHDFLRTYPKMRMVSFLGDGTHGTFWGNLLFELSYGLDFVTIEIFFRGFLVLAFLRYAGQEAVLPMAVFYCSIHFGKPMMECVSSFFGGITLGIVVSRTGSIAGGLMVHLGIAWMMELGGVIGRGI